MLNIISNCLGERELGYDRINLFGQDGKNWETCGGNVGIVLINK